MLNFEMSFMLKLVGICLENLHAFFTLLLLLLLLSGGQRPPNGKDSIAARASR